MTVLQNDATTSHPMCFAQDREGNVFWANGLERPQRWQLGMSSSEDAGITAPETSCSIGASSSGDIQGVYNAAVQYIDNEGIGSSFSPLALAEVTDQGYGQIDYSSIPTPSEGRVTKRRLWRTTDGQTSTYYQDLEMTGTTLTSATGTKTDAQLIESTAMRFVTAKGWPNARRFGVPPANMSVVQFFQNRSWWAVPGEYAEGTATVSGTAAHGTGTQWSSNLEGQYFHLGNDLAEIDTVTNATNIVLATSITAGSGGYKIIPDSAEWDSVYFSEDAEPESVPSSNKIATYPDGDRMTGLMPLYGAMFLLKRNHIYRLTICSDPRDGTQISLVAERGCLNQRCWCRAEGMAFLMDRNGAYLFNGSTTQAISGPVQNYWRDEIYWPSHKWFSVVHDKRRECIMFLVALDSDAKPQHALCFSYRLQRENEPGRWWLEDYAGANVGAVCEGVIADVPRVLGGVDSTNCLMDEGNTDEGSAIAYDVKFGRWRFPEVGHEQTRGVGVRYEPVSASHSTYLSYYYDGSASAETATYAWNDNQGVSIAAGGNAALDMTTTKGYLYCPIDGRGFEAPVAANRSMEVELTGSISEGLTIYEVMVDGVNE
jgi:hypothetical protein